MEPPRELLGGLLRPVEILEMETHDVLIAGARRKETGSLGPKTPYEKDVREG
ncbi:MAG TPA: hypothetical protein VMU69_18660 [Bradyrhizobium sp.]|nr:hypothetical protein [Bradyrhizobium sp.]